MLFLLSARLYLCVSRARSHFQVCVCVFVRVCVCACINARARAFMYTMHTHTRSRVEYVHTHIHGSVSVACDSVSSIATVQRECTRARPAHTSRGFRRSCRRRRWCRRFCVVCVFCDAASLPACVRVFRESTGVRSAVCVTINPLTESASIRQCAGVCEPQSHTRDTNYTFGASDLTRTRTHSALYNCGKNANTPTPEAKEHCKSADQQYRDDYD